MSRLKKFMQILTAITAGAGLSTLIFFGAQKTMIQLPTTKEIQEATNISAQLPVEERTTLRRSRESTVRVLSVGTKGGVATTTGTYFKMNGNYYVLTVMHGLVGSCAVTRIWTEEEGFTPCNEVVVGNTAIDYAIIAVDEIPSRTPVNMLRVLPNGTQWKEALSTQTKLFYTGFPNSTGPLTFEGRVVGYADGDYIYMNSFAWGGASGSGVFTAKGQFVGYVLAIDIGQTDYGVDVLEDIVIVVPAFKIDWATILQ
jgi:hypothetical protein